MYVQHDMGKNSEGTDVTVGDAPLPHEKALRDGMWRGHGGFEIALSPVFFGAGGWMLDGALGWTPALMITGVVLGFVGAVANQYYRYKAAMEIESAERLSKKQSRNSETAPSITNSFGRVQEASVDMSIDFNAPRPTFDAQLDPRLSDQAAS